MFSLSLPNIVLIIICIIIILSIIYAPRLINLFSIILVSIIVYIIYISIPKKNPEKIRDIKAKIWSTISNSEFPELCPNLVSKTPDINGVSFAISGGGSRSFVSMMGYFRALNKMKSLNNVQYVSTVSGGSWFYGLYSYCKNNNKDLSDSDLLGENFDSSASSGLSNITLDVLKILNNKDSYFGKIFESQDLHKYFVEGLLNSDVSNDLAWNYAINKYILDPYNLNDIVPASLNQKESLDICSKNQAIKYTLYLSDDNPFWICNTTLLSSNYKGIVVPMTPLYSGISNIVTSMDNTKTIGGELFENFSFGNSSFTDISTIQTLNISCSSTQNAYSLKQKGNYRTLSDMIGTSSTAYAQVFYDKANNSILKDSILLGLLDNIPSNELIPKYNIYENSLTSSNKYNNVTMQLGDGAFSDNTGILSLLARGVKKIIAFINTENPNITTSDKTFNNDISLLFGYGQKTNKFTYENDKHNYNKNLSEYLKNSFKNDKENIEPLSSTQVFKKEAYHNPESSDPNTILSKLQNSYNSGGPTFARASLEVQENKINGINGGYVVDILFIVLQPSVNFINELSKNLKDQITTKNGPFNNFPNYLTILQNNNPGVVSLTLEQTNLLSIYTEWCLEQEPLKENILDMISPQRLIPTF